MEQEIFLTFNDYIDDEKFGLTACRSIHKDLKDARITCDHLRAQSRSGFISIWSINLTTLIHKKVGHMAKYSEEWKWRSSDYSSPLRLEAKPI